MVLTSVKSSNRRNKRTRTLTMMV